LNKVDAVSDDRSPKTSPEARVPCVTRMIIAEFVAQLQLPGPPAWRASTKTNRRFIAADGNALEFERTGGDLRKDERRGDAKGGITEDGRIGRRETRQNYQSNLMRNM
jgi:hypothetical protein